MSSNTATPSTRRGGYVTELHYADGDVGAYDDVDVRQVWAYFTNKHEPSYILIRPNTEEGQQLSDTLHNAHKMAAALNQFVDTINSTGGVIATEPGTLAPMADEEWLDLGLAYTLACEALGMKATISEEVRDIQELEPDVRLSGT
jgi:hypothetical protein